MSKISFKPADTGTATFTLEAPATNTNRTITLPDEAGTLATVENLPSGEITSGDLPAGSVIQVVSTTYNDTFSTTSVSPVTVTGFFASITPQSQSSKILVIFSAYVGFNDNDPYPYFLLERNGVSIGLGQNASGNRINTFASAPSVPGSGDSRTHYKLLNVSRNYLDSPSTLAEVTYQLKFASAFRSASYINRQSSSTDKEYIQYPSSDITLMEIAG